MAVFKKILFFDHLYRGTRRNGSDRIAAKGGNRQALKCIGEFRGGDRRPDGDAIAEPFGAGDYVRRNLPLLDAEPFLAGPAEAGLNFVGDEQAAIFFYGLEDDLEIFRRRRDE